MESNTYGTQSYGAALAVLLDDLQRYGVSDALAETPFVWQAEKLFAPAHRVVPTATEVEAPAPKNPPQSPIASTEAKTAVETAAPKRASRSYSQPANTAAAPQVWVVGSGAKLLVVAAGKKVEQKPFVGAAEQLFAKMLQALNLKEADVTFIVMPELENRADYSGYTALLHQAVAEQTASNVLLMGQKIADTVLGAEGGFAENRDRLLQWRGKQVLTSYQPQMLLVQPFLKRLSWLMLRKLRQNF